MAISDDDTHLIDLDAFDGGGGVGIQFGGVWGDAWKALNETSALPPANLLTVAPLLMPSSANFEGAGPDKLGFFARSVRGNESIGYRQDEPFYLASTTKIAIHTRLWQLFEAGHLDLDADTILYGDPADPFHDPNFADSAVPWYVDERANVGLATFNGCEFHLGSRSGPDPALH